MKETLEVTGPISPVPLQQTSPVHLQQTEQRSADAAGHKAISAWADHSAVELRPTPQPAVPPPSDEEASGHAAKHREELRLAALQAWAEHSEVELKSLGGDPVHSWAELSGVELKAMGSGALERWARVSKVEVPGLDTDAFQGRRLGGSLSKVHHMPSQRTELLRPCSRSPALRVWQRPGQRGQRGHEGPTAAR